MPSRKHTKKVDVPAANTQAERATVQEEIDEVSKKRDTHIQAENKRLAAEGKGDSFDEKIAQTIRKQAEKNGTSHE